MNQHNDVPMGRLIEIMNAYIAKGYDVYVKWTCPKCGDRCISNEKNCFQTQGYRHEEKVDGSPCGEIYWGPLYGVLASWSRKYEGEPVPELP